ncbi:MAG TPA: PAS domain S-box protein [Dongiaceae bacterium]|nr:PAS domain S-box protein [Dongiaceae bacterium]
MSIQDTTQAPPARHSRLPFSSFAIAALLLAHIAVLAAFSQSPSLPAWSDFFQLAASLLTTLICILAGRRSPGIARPFWLLNAAALGTWSLGKCLVIYDFDYLGLTNVRIAPLLLFFLAAAPMFVTVFLSRDDFHDSLNWEWVLDASQILVLILVLYLFLVYVPLLYYGDRVIEPLEDLLLLFRNIVLSASLLLRAFLSRSRLIRRLYLPLGVIMAAFAASTWFGNRAQELSPAPVTSWWDLAWSIPFCAIAWHAASWQDRDEPPTGNKEAVAFSGVFFAYVPSLLLPVLLLWNYRHILREQIFLGLFGLIFSMLLFNARLLLTHRRQRLTAEALHASEHQYRSLFERNMAGVFRSTVDGKLLDCNPALAAMTGYTREELLQNPTGILFFGGNEERRRVIHSLAGSPAAPFEYCVRRKDGSPLWLLINASFERKPSGTTIIEGTAIDITERQLNNILIEDWKNRYDAAIQASRQIIYESDPDSKYVTLGGCVREILGYSAQELSGPSQAWLALIHPEDRSHYFERLRAAAATKQAVEFDFRARSADNSYRILQEQCRAVFNDKGQVLRIVGFISDITDRRALESQLRQAQKMEAIGRLAGGVAHDFNNLLTVINGYSSILLDQAAPAGQFRNELEQIRAAADRAASLTRQLLAFSRQTVLQPRHLNLNEVVRGVDKMLRRLIGEDIEVMTVLASDLGIVRVDPGQIEQVLMNLVVNARDAMPNGGRLTIQTENVNLDENYTLKHDYVKPGSYVLFAVSDSGTGIPEEIQSRVFEPFFTTKEPGKGTGLGLPMVYGIVKQSGGSVELYSELSCGTTVKIYLPRVEAAVEQVSRVNKEAPAAHGTEKILLVEDDAVLRGLASDILHSHGYTVYPVAQLSDLDSLLAKLPSCDLLLTDVVMPKMRGPELAGRVAQRWPAIRVLYMSGYTTNAIVHHGVLDSGVFFLQKPFTPAALIAKVREVLDAKPKLIQ